MAPFRQRTIYEVNPELSFFQLNGEEPLRWSKHSEKGHEERSALLEEKVPGALRVISTPRFPVQPSRTCSTPLPSCGRRAGSSPTPGSASRPTPNGTSRACAWSSSANPAQLALPGDRGQKVWCVNGRRSSGPAKTATAAAQGEEHPVRDPIPSAQSAGGDERDSRARLRSGWPRRSQQDVATHRATRGPGPARRQPDVTEAQQPRADEVHGEEHDEPPCRAGEADQVVPATRPSPPQPATRAQRPDRSAGRRSSSAAPCAPCRYTTAPGGRRRAPGTPGGPSDTRTALPARRTRRRTPASTSG